MWLIDRKETSFSENDYIICIFLFLRTNRKTPVLLNQLTSDIEPTSTRVTPITCDHLTLVQARVFSPESGHMKSESSFSEDVFVPLDSSCKLFILRLWDLNSFMEMKQDWSIDSYQFTEDIQRVGESVRVGCEGPLQCDVVVLLCLIGGLGHIHYKCSC